MYSKTLLIAALVAYAEARFGQEQVPVAAISALGSRGQAGQAATLAGSVPGVLLAAASACAKLELADKIVSQLGNTDDVIAAAKGLVAAEMNFNPFAVSIPKICDDATLPATAALRGIVPLVDPAVGGQDVQNANSKKSLTTPFDATGLSVAAISIAQGFSNFTLGDTKTLASAGAGAATGNTGTGANTGNANTGNSTTDTNTDTNTNTGSTCTGSTNSNTNAGTSNTGTGNSTNTDSGSSSGVQQSTISGLDFGLCVPTMKFVGGQGNRPATEFTFQAIDALVAKGQQEALNPNIITNRICDQLTNVCQANQAAKDACLAAKAQIQALGTRDVTTADAWNSALGFAGASTN